MTKMNKSEKITIAYLSIEYCEEWLRRRNAWQWARPGDAFRATKKASLK